MTTRARYRNGVLEFFDSATQERVKPIAPVLFEDDFIGAGSLVIPAAASEESGADWSKHIVGAAPPTVAGIADAASGAVRCALTSDSQAQTAGLSHGDNRSFSIEQGAAFECRLKVSTLPTLVAEAVWGLVGDYNAAPDSITYSAFFTADGDGVIACEVDDNSDDQSEASGVTVLATEWHVYRIDFFDLTDIRFFIDGARVATTAKTYGATGANAVLQPYFACYKASGAGVGAIDVDYCRVWQKRS